ncbi:SUF system NifU family Fe-S cluster assembly protein [Candidatus Haliotispira prima]|uniref:SUF system NifU family Fe-S cluster assembly protein n=1 Tax=Candidatus Haliotispira prima TaxID=3034016 RepID=A0ABY8MIM9_9SPIO|nr:SUF system NifU family Fe-S cluster assembly protein [Candidatus Haliotispira prima]
MGNIEQLYQDTILSHNRSPRNFRKLEQFSHTTIGRNPLCGDVYQLFARIEDEHITDIGFQGDGCAISKASSSIMSELVKGKTLTEAGKYKDDFLQLLLAAKEEQQESVLAKLPRKLQVFRGISEYPMRVKCATLIWRALEAILQGQGAEAETAVSTE